MKHIGFLLLLICWLSAPAQYFNGGVIAGGLISQVDGDTWKGYDKFGYLAGGYVTLTLSPHSAFRMEMEYIQKGSRHDIDQKNPADQSYLLRLHYLEIPVLYEYTFARKFSAEAGPAMDVLMKATELQDGIESPPTEPFRDVTLSGILGVSYRITGHLKANMRLNYSLISLRDATAPYPASYRKILFEYGQFNNLLSLSLMWDFKLNDQ